MIKLHKGIYIEGSTICISADIASHYIPYAVLEYMPSFRGHYYCKEEIPIFFCPMLAVKLIDTLYKKDTCTSKLEHLQTCLDYTLLDMKHFHPHFMFSDTKASFKEFRQRCSTSLFCSQTNIDDYFK